MKIRKLCGAIICGGLIAGGLFDTAQGQPLLYQWDFNNANPTSGANLAVPPTVVDTVDGYTGGNLSVFVNGPSGTLSTPPGSGLYGSPNSADLGLVNSGLYSSAAGALAGGVGDLSQITNFTVSLWFNLNSGVNNFYSVNGAQYNGRLFCIDSNVTGTTADGNELYFALAVPSAAGQPLRIQFGVFIPTGQPAVAPFGSVGGASPATFTNQWVFIAASYTPAAGGTANIYVGTTNTLASLAATMTGVGTLSAANHWLSTSNLVTIGNRIASSGNRALMGTMDDVRLYGSALTAAQVQTVQGIIVPPTITTPPTPQTPFAGAPASLTVAATGSLPLYYQWQRSGTNLTDGGNISGSLTTNLAISNVSAADVAGYNVIVSNSGGAVTSSVVALNLAAPAAPTITLPPLPQMVYAGGIAGFTVAASGSLPLYYQWQKTSINLTNGGNISGATNASLTIGNVSAGDVAGYAVVVSNFVGAVTSSVVALTLTSNTSSILYLSGTDKDHTVPWQFFMTGGGRSNNVQTTIPVPSCWQTKGFGNYSYQNKPASTSVGQYTTTFSVPTSWAGQRIYLVYEGVLTDTATVINGQPVGSLHQGGFYEFSYEVTTNVVVGASTNVLNVTVNEWSANTSVNSAERQGDYWNFSGIFRPVYLMVKPPANIDRLTVNAQASGLINVGVFLNSITSDSLVVASVTDSNNVQLGSAFTNTVTAGATNVQLSATLPAPRLWSAEFPNLYTLTVQLRDVNGGLIHTLTNQIGFRTITFVNNSGYYVNGQKVLLRGVCRHEFWPTDGRTTSRAISDLDIGLIKDMNYNAVRMSHYPPGKHFLEECDRLGLYVFDELSGWQHAYDNTIAPQVVREMVIRDVNHPCIIAWDNGNEGGWNSTVDGNFALWDPQNRHVNHPLSANFNNVCDDHYPTWSTFITRFGAGALVCLPTEINHGLYDGGGGASLSDYWDMIRTNSNGAGMFLWAFLDEGVVRDDLGGQIDVQDLLAPDGIVGPYRQPEASYYTYKATYNPAQVTGPIAGAPFTGTLAVENRFSFTSLNQCTFRWQLGWYPDANDPTNTFNTSTNPLTGGMLVALASGSFAGPNVAPGATGSLVLPGFPTNGTNYDALRLTATDPFGNNLYTWTWPLHTPAQIRDRIIGAVAASAPAISAGTSATEIIVTNGPRVFRFNKTTGVINGVTVSNQTVSLSNGPRPAAGAAWTVSSVANSSDGTNYVILVNDLSNAANGFQWTLRPDGWLKLTYRYTLTGAQNYLGITFDYPSANVTAMSWLGQGPYRVYKNRTAGQEIFVHTKAYNNTWTGQDPLVAAAAGTSPWVYPEFAGYHGELNWATLQTTEQPITVVTPTPDLFFRVLTPPVNDSKNGNVNVAYPPGQLSLLDGIAPQGDKFRAAGLGSYGPSSAQTTAAGLYTGEASFFFGPLPVLPGVPAGLTAMAGNGTAALSWNAVAGATGYNLKRAPSSGGPYSVIASNLPGLVFTNTGLQNGTSYYYVVSAVNATGEGKTSSPVGVMPVNVTVPKISGVSLSGPNLIVNGSNGPAGTSYLVLTSSNLTLPLSNWVVLATNSFASDGGFIFTNPVLPSGPQQFYRLKLP